jgi:hypothetical protein
MLCVSAVCWPVVRGPGGDSSMLKVDGGVVKLVSRVTNYLIALQYHVQVCSEKTMKQWSERKVPK